MAHGHIDTAAFNSDFSGYRVADQKVGVADPNIMYYGYLNQFGDYYIMENNTTDGTYRFVRGTGNYSAAFALRESLDYDYVDAIFK